jgi:DNA-binding response OmpR family regulator
MNTELATQKETRAAATTIIVVEDDLNIGALLVEAIRQGTPYQAVLATQGTQALDLLRGLTPRLIILDYRLPDMNGIELYERVHALKTLDEVPVLLISAEITPDFKDVAARHLTLLSKPFELTDLFNEIEKLLASNDPSHH